MANVASMPYHFFVRPMPSSRNHILPVNHARNYRLPTPSSHGCSRIGVTPVMQNLLRRCHLGKRRHAMKLEQRVWADCLQSRFKHGGLRERRRDVEYYGDLA